MGGRSAPRANSSRSCCHGSRPRSTCCRQARRRAGCSSWARSRSRSRSACRSSGRDGDASQLLRNRRATRHADADRGRRHADQDVRVRPVQRRDRRVPVSRRHLRRGDLLGDDRAPRDQSHLDARRDPSGPQARRPSSSSRRRTRSPSSGSAPCSRGGGPSSTTTAPSFGYGARHNREYASYELYALLEETGFDIESMTRTRSRHARAAGAPPARRSCARCCVLLDTSRRAHLFLRARRRPVFRWRFPPALFTQPNVYPLRPLSLGGDGGERRRSSARRAGSPPSSFRTAAGSAACAASTLPCPVGRRCCAAPPA